MYKRQIEDQAISRRHALIDRSADQYTIEDLNSVNGMLLNGKFRVTVNLRPGDVITIGSVNMVFGIQESSNDDTGEHAANNVIAFGETQWISAELAPGKSHGPQ